MKKIIREESSLIKTAFSLHYIDLMKQPPGHDCITDEEIVSLCEGRILSERESQIRTHFESCERCKFRYKDLGNDLRSWEQIKEDVEKDQFHIPEEMQQAFARGEQKFWERVKENEETIS